MEQWKAGFQFFTFRRLSLPNNFRILLCLMLIILTLRYPRFELITILNWVSEGHASRKLFTSPETVSLLAPVYSILIPTTPTIIMNLYVFFYHKL